MSDIEKIPKENKEAISKLDNFSNSGEMLAFAKILCESKLVPGTYNTPEKVLLCVAQGRELGLPAITSLYNVYFISGRPVLSIHAILALLAKNKISYTTEEDFVEVKDKDGKLIDVRTTITFYRKNEYLNMVLKETISFTWLEAKEAGLASKEVWLKFRKIMLWNRCATFGARRIAPDILLGVMETAEAGDTFSKKYSVNDDGNAIIEI